MGVVNPHKIRNCDNCDEQSLCDGCDELVHQTKEFSANPNKLKRQTPDEFDHMLPKYKTTWMWQLILLNGCKSKSRIWKDKKW